MDLYTGLPRKQLFFHSYETITMAHADHSSNREVHGASLSFEFELLFGIDILRLILGNLSGNGHGKKVLTSGLCQGANVDSHEKNGYTPLINAAFNNYLEIVRVLIAAGNVLAHGNVL